MARQNAALDDNNRPSLLATDPLTGETRLIKLAPSGVGLGVGLGDVLSTANDSILANEGGWTYIKLTASGVVFTGACVFGGVIVLSSTSGVVSVYDNTAASGEQPSGQNGLSVAAGDMKTLLKPVRMVNGVYISITGTATIYALVRQY